MSELLRRRAVLAGAGCAVLALMGACGSDDPEQPANAGGEENAAGLPVKAASVPVGSGIVAGDVLVLQLTQGSFTAYSAICPHQNFVVQAPDTNGTITCLGHMSHFNAKDGAVIDGPSPRGLIPVNVKLDGENIVRA